MSICFLINTYNRKESCQRLVDSLQGLGNIVVLGDYVDYTISGCNFYNMKAHYGRQGYWKTVTDLWRRKGQHDYYFMLPDDFLPVDGLVDKAISIWKSIPDPQKICLNLYADRIGKRCWTELLPVDRGDVWQTGWVDMCFMAEERFFRVVHLRNGVVNISSGVGAQISRSLVKQNYSLFQVKESLVYPQPEHGISEMHKEPIANPHKVIKHRR